MKKTLLWLGAGEAQTPNLDFSEYDQIILVDPLLKQSGQNFTDNEKVTLLPKAVVANSQEASSFYILNNEEFSSFYPPTGLKDIYPNVFVEEARQVPVTNINEIISQFSIGGSDNTLIIDLPCLSCAILDTLKDSKTLFLFSDVYASAGKLPLYEKSESIAEITKNFESVFFEFSEDCSEDADICLYRFTFSEKLEELSRLNNEICDLKEQIKLVVTSMQDAEGEKEELSTLLSNSQTAFSELQTEKVVIDTQLDKLLAERNALLGENRSLALEKTQLNEELSRLNDELNKSKSLQDKVIEERDTYEMRTSGLVKKLHEAESKIESLHSEASNHSDKISELTDSLSSSQTAFAKLEQEKESSDTQLNKLLAEHKALQDEYKSVFLAKTQLGEKVAQLNDELNKSQSQQDRMTEKRDTYVAKNNDLDKKLHEAQSKVESLQNKISEHSSNAKVLQDEYQNLEANNTNLQSQLKEAGSLKEKLKAENEEQKSAFDSEIATKQSQIKELENKLVASEEKQKETYSWFASRKKQADALIKQVEVLKRENELLASKNDTAAAISALESKVSSILQKQSDDNIEIANALGKHVTKCSLEQKISMASLFELRKLPAFANLPMSYSEHTMDTPNLAELSSLISLNSFDVIVEFGSGLSTVVAASVTDEKIKAKNSDAKLAIPNVGEESSSQSFANALPNYVISFEQEAKYLNNTKNLLNASGLSAYVDLYHAPLTQSQYSMDGERGVYYDCLEKLLELKRVFNNRNAKVLVIIDGPSIQKDKASSVYAALPTVLDYLSQCDITMFANNANQFEDSNLIESWENEINRRQLTMISHNIETPQGAFIFRIHS
ncbi:hypothetical protein [Alteromonas stellipolaris]|uniref:Uncharacterized protein n=1 Tax=Alteromonas stellipolaris TaxID=233316 RepID=A0AAW7Z218_9ALTE|nr:hypothetical protein [Alteromonas stellipolaris]MDO6578815.1 hypothetical protein [Alteromonas stellipolaris]MDP2536445.1 hypothetical protein [Alteromonas stellipolaris]